MAANSAAKLDHVVAKGSAARFATSELRGESTRKEFAESDEAREMGRIITRIGEIAGLTDQQVGQELGYAGGSEVSRWKSGAAVPGFLARLVKHPRLRAVLVEALAESVADGSVIVEKTIRIQRRSA